MNKEHKIANRVIRGFNGRKVSEIVEEYMDKDYIDIIGKTEFNLIFEEGNFELPDCYYNFIMSVVMLKHFKHDYMVQVDVDYSIQIGEFVSLTDAIVKDAYSEYTYRKLWEKNENNNSVIDVMDLFTKPVPIKYLSLIYPIKNLVEQNSDFEYIHEIAFKQYCSSQYLNEEGIKLLLPALFVVWLNTYNPIEMIEPEEPIYKMLLTLLLPPRTEKEFAKNCDIETRLINRIICKPLYSSEFNVAEFYSDENICKLYYNRLYREKCNKTKCTDIERKMCHEKMGTDIIKLMEENIEIDSSFEINPSNSISDDIQELTLGNKIINSDELWNIMYKFEEKRKANERYPITVSNILYLQKIFIRIAKNNKGGTLPSKILSLIFLNYKTSWIDLLLINKGLPINATEIIGINTKNILSKYFGESGGTDNSIYNTFDLYPISEAINTIINFLIEEFNSLDNKNKKYGKYYLDLIKRNYGNENGLFEEILNEKLANRISMRSIIELAEYESQ